MEEASDQKNPTKWVRRNKLLIIIVTFTVILPVVTLCIILYITLQPGPDICETAGCKKISNLILNRMDPTVDPCDNFYNFACGNTARSTLMPKSKFSVNSFTAVSDEVIQQLKQVLETPINSSEPKSFGLAKKYYKTCMNESKIEADNLTTIKNILQKLGGWPILEGDKWNEKEFDWLKLTYKLNELGFDVSYFFDLNIEPDKKNNSKYILQVSQPDFSNNNDLVSSVSGKDLMYKYYFNLIIDTAIYFGANKTVAEKDAHQMLLLYNYTSTIYLSREELKNASKMYNALTIEQMEQKYKFIPWLEYLNNIFYQNIHLTKDEIIINKTPKYIENLECLILLFDKRTIANYILWSTVKSVMATLPKRMSEIRLKFESVALGISEKKERWIDCVVNTHKNLGLLTGALYVRQYFNSEAKHKAMDVIENIRNTFVADILQKNTWMDDVTKRKAIKKAKAMKVHIGYPDQLLNDKTLDNFYQKLKITDNLLESNLLVNQFFFNFSVKQFRKTVEESEWVLIGMITASVNAFYMFNRNAIGFPAGILQDIFFSKDRPGYVNYGSIGYIIGHEITHGFDDQGREYDHAGNLVNWWTRKSEHHFHKISTGIIKQYNNFVIPELYNVTVNGFLTVGENIADNGGVKTAYYAYISTNKDKEEPYLPGLTSYTPRQMFWLSAATTWCSVDRPDYLHIFSHLDPHSPTRFRVIGPLSNLDEFADDFKCPLGSNMNPKVKYQLW